MARWDAAEADRFREAEIGSVGMLEAGVEIVEAEAGFVGEGLGEHVRLRPHEVSAVVLLLAIVTETAAV